MNNHQLTTEMFGGGIKRPTSDSMPPGWSRSNSLHQHNPFSTPAMSILSEPRSPTESTSGARPRRRFKSSRLTGEYEKPWLDKKNRAMPWDAITFYSAVTASFLIGGYLLYDAYIKVPRHEYCLILDDKFATLDTNTWSHEIQVNGYGTGSFDWTTDDPANTYFDAAGLHIVPTLTLESTDITVDQLMNGYTVNLTADGTCTNSGGHRSSEDYVSPCSVVSNSTKNQIINPVRSARLTTAGKKTIKYGRVEVTAQMPKGDWLWPAIWLMPQDSVYGEWPRSGEIDIAESRGNDAEKYGLGNNIIGSALHWGTSYDNNMVDRSKGEWGSKRIKYSEGFHTYGLEWSEKYLFLWLDGRLRQVLFVDFKAMGSLWDYGKFGQTAINGTAPDNPWAKGGSNAPFDQSFYLILNVAVGSTNGYFPDKFGEKPWLDGSKNAMGDFWKANQTWLPTWGEGSTRGMTVNRVRMWQEGTC
ncbi:hypothetical protein VTL71DRAFT_9272 [Oculimacula yallundae]|uniref:GH16 domain-containing protein n=1 Tax=Oculimacula yallundae TaxID=86028 RepID=A0ABR4BU54_9HELO